MAAGGARGTSHCLVCNVAVTEGTDCRDIFQYSGLAERLQPILQVALYEGSSFTRNLCLNCEIQVGIVEEYYKVLDKFRKRFGHTVSFYGLELVPIPEAQKSAYQYIQATQGQLPAFSQAHTQPQTPVQTPIQTPVSQGHWEEILFCLEPQNAQAAPQPVMTSTPNAIESSVTLVQNHHHHQQLTSHHQQLTAQQLTSQLTSSQLTSQQQHQASDKNAVPRVPEFYVYKKNASRHPLTDRQHVCSVCHKGFLNGTHLKQHMRSHTGERPYKCPECSASFSMQCNLKRHLLLHTGERPYTCTQCGSRYKQLAHLKRHMRTHDGSRPFECEHCSKNFRFEHDFKEHMRLHTGEGPYRCQMCGNCFLRQRSYKEHLKVHSDERPHKCVICPANYKRRSELVIHMRRHTGEKPYTCDICDKAFVTSSKLSIHKALHKDLRPFECSTCLAKFKQKNNLKAHQRTHDRKPVVLAEMEVIEATLQKTLIEEIKIKKKKKKKRKSMMVDSSTCMSENNNRDVEGDDSQSTRTDNDLVVQQIDQHESNAIVAEDIELREVSGGGVEEHHYEVIVMDGENPDVQGVVHHEVHDIVHTNETTIQGIGPDGATTNGVPTILVHEVRKEAESLLSAENIVLQGTHHLDDQDPNREAGISENRPSVT